MSENFENLPENKSIITIAGQPGSGKSTTAKVVAAELGYDHFSSGDLFRKITADYGLDVMSGNLHAEENKAIDQKVDQALIDIGQSGSELVIDSRMAWHWMPQSFKVYLDLDTTVAAKRILANIDEERAKVEHIPTDPYEYAEILSRRLESEARRYHALYGVNPYDLSNYDLVINTAENDVAQATQLVIDGFKRWRS